MKKLFFVLSICILFLLAGCSQTKVTSFVDPDFKDKKYMKLIIFAATDNLALRSKFEKIVINQFNERNQYKQYSVFAVSSLDLFPPTREIKPEEVQAVFEANQIDGILQIEVKGSQMKTDVIQFPSQTNSRSTIIGNDIYTNSTTYSSDIKSTTTSTSYDIKIIDVETGKTAWMATANTSSTDAISANEPLKSFAKGIIDKLEADNML